MSVTATLNFNFGMYLPNLVNVPAVTGKIVRKKKGASIYVLFETDRVYDPKRKFNVPKRVIIGKLVSDADDALMQPNENFGSSEISGQPLLKK